MDSSILFGFSEWLFLISQVTLKNFVMFSRHRADNQRDLQGNLRDPSSQRGKWPWVQFLLNIPVFVVGTSLDDH